jgi:hypothetical protein
MLNPMNQHMGFNQYVFARRTRRRVGVPLM